MAQSDQESANAWLYGGLLLFVVLIGASTWLGGWYWTRLVTVRGTSSSIVNTTPLKAHQAYGVEVEAPKADYVQLTERMIDRGEGVAALFSTLCRCSSQP